MSVFGRKKSWAETQQNLFESESPILTKFHEEASRLKSKLDELRESAEVPATGEKRRALTAFYLGFLEAKYQQQIEDPMAVIDGRLQQIAIAAALYTAVKDRDISNDGEWGALAYSFNEASNNELAEFWDCGRGYGGGVLESTPKEEWEEFLTIFNKL